MNPQAINILLISSRADIGGGPKVMYDQIRELQNQFGNCLKIFTASPDGQTFSKMFKEVSYLHFKLPFRKYSVFRVLLLIYFCKKNKIQIAHSHGRGARLYAMPLKLLGIKVVHTLHGCHAPTSIISKIILFIEKRLTSFVDIFICISESEMDFATQVGVIDKSKTNILTNGLYTQDYQKVTPQTEIKNLMDTYNISTSKKIMGVLTRLTAHKNNICLIKMFEYVEEIYPNKYQLIIAGDGEQFNYLKEEIKKRDLEKLVILTGDINNIHSFFSIIDIYISSSIGEGLPLSVLEALYFKKPCLLSCVAGHLDLKDYSSLYKLDDPHDFATKLSLLEYNINYDISKFDLEVIVTELFQLYSSLDLRSLKEE